MQFTLSIVAACAHRYDVPSLMIAMVAKSVEREMAESLCAAEKDAGEGSRDAIEAGCVPYDRPRGEVIAETRRNSDLGFG